MITETEVAPGAEQAGVAHSPLRFVTVASLFDGHDAAINVMRRLIQDSGAEVVHLGHNRSVSDVVRAAIQEDADAIAISSYQGGHIEYFKYCDRHAPRARRRAHPRVRRGRGHDHQAGDRRAEAYGVERIYDPGHGMSMGLTGMIDDLIARTAAHRVVTAEPPADPTADDLSIAQMLSALEDGVIDEGELEQLRAQWGAATSRAPVVGITGTGGAGKSTVTDELLSRFVERFPGLRVAVLAVDPTRRRTGGALLGDRIRMNSLRDERIYMRSMATRRSNRSTSAMLDDALAFLRCAGFDLVIVETAGIGQSDSEIVDLVDVPVYVMTSEFGAASQLEKIDMLDLAAIVVINKFDKRGAPDALRDVRKQWRRNHVAFTVADEEIPVYPTIASQFNDPGVTWMFVNLCRAIGELPGAQADRWDPGEAPSSHEPLGNVLIPAGRAGYLAEIARAGSRDQRRGGASCRAGVEGGAPVRGPAGARRSVVAGAARALSVGCDRIVGGRRCGGAADPLQRDAVGSRPEALELLRGWPARLEAITGETYSYTVRGREITGENYRTRSAGSGSRSSRRRATTAGATACGS